MLPLPTAPNPASFENLFSPLHPSLSSHTSYSHTYSFSYQSIISSTPWGLFIFFLIMSRKDDAKAHDGQVTVNVDDFTRTRESVSSLVFLQKWFCEDAAAPPPPRELVVVSVYHRPPTPASTCPLRPTRQVNKPPARTPSRYTYLWTTDALSAG